jgi:hypothetical protein
VAKERNNIYAVAADAVDLALDTAGAMGSMVGSIANAVGIGRYPDEKEKNEADDAAGRVSKSLRQEAEAAKPPSRKAHVGAPMRLKRARLRRILGAQKRRPSEWHGRLHSRKPELV